MTSVANGKNPQKNPKRRLGVGLIPGNPGNSGGKKGRSGRKKIEFKAECERLSDYEILPRLEAKIKAATPDDQAWRWAADKVLEYSKAKAPQEQRHTGAEGAPLPAPILHVYVPSNGRNGNGRNGHR